MKPLYRALTKRSFDVAYSDKLWYSKVIPSDEHVDLSIGVETRTGGEAKVLVALKGIAMKHHGFYEDLDLTRGVDDFAERIAETYVRRADKWQKEDVHREYTPAAGGGNSLPDDRVDEFRAKLKSSLKSGMEELLTW